jgi:diadenosine tetraphosphate (Ap4A) HIT family hydrolase
MISPSQEACSVCSEISQWKAGQNLFIVAEFKLSLFVVGEHQFFEGYSLLLLKEHVRDLHELTLTSQEELFRELMIATKALVRRYTPWKMNYASYGNVAPHVHWHLIPRYDSDPDRESQPWQHEQEFADHRISPEKARLIGEEIRRHL